MSELIKLEDVKLKGVGDANLAKLKKAGITSLNAIAILTSVELVSYTGMGIETAQKTITQARDIISPGFITATEVQEMRILTPPLDTGSSELNRILGGGVHPAAINEFIGEFGSGKSQIALTAMVECAANGGKVIDVDTEGTHNPSRLSQIAVARGYDPKIVLENIIMARAYNAEHLAILVNELSSQVVKHEAKLVVVDSIISHFRGEYIGLGMLAERQQKLASVVHMMTRISEGFRIPVIVTNQVQTNIGKMFGDPNQPAGGNIMAHAGTYRIFLRKGRLDKETGNQTVLASVIDSAELPQDKTRIMLSVAGVVDEDGSFPTQVTLEEVLDE